MNNQRNSSTNKIAALRFAAVAIGVCLVGKFAQAQQPATVEKPNVILIFTDDQGYGDVGCYGAKGFKTPNIDQMAKEGVRLDSFYTNCSVCSGSRCSLMTGRYYKRVGVRAVYFPGNTGGLSPQETTIAEIMKRLGYATGIIGKWHLGHLPQFLPMRQGFDYYYGIPYSNDMAIDRKSAVFAKDAVFRMGISRDNVKTKKAKRNWVPLFRDDKVIEYPADQSTLTKRYTEEAIQFIGKNRDKRFFLYLPHTFPHVPMFVSKKFKGRTKSLFGDVMEELDWSVGEVLNAVKKNGIDRKTLVIFTTDNGTHRGSSGPLRGRKAGDYEGGYRVPFIARWPGKIKAGTASNEVAATIDMLPTIAAIGGGEAPKDRVIDGKDISPLLFESGAKSPHKHYFLAHRRGSVRSGKWKFYPWPEGKGKGKKKKKLPPGQPKVQLYDLSNDLSEKNNVAEKHPQVVAELHAAFKAHLADIKKKGLPKKTSRLHEVSFEEEKKGKWIKLFNGKNLDGWKVKIAGHKVGDNYKNTFRVENGILKVVYDKYKTWGGKFGHLFYKTSFSHYVIRVEYRFTGGQVPGGPSWAFRNSGIMVHGQTPESMTIKQNFPVSIEVQLLGGRESGTRTTANLCTPGTHVVMNGKLQKRHCISSKSKTYRGDQWVKVEVEVRGNKIIRHRVNGKEVMSYTQPQLDENDGDAKRLLKTQKKMLDRGTISLQSESHPVEFRRVELMKLEP